MIRLMLPLALLIGVVRPAAAHFVFVVPQAGAAKADVVLSEDLKADQNVDIATIQEAKLFLRESTGKDAPLQLIFADDACQVALPGSGARLIHGVCVFGVMQRGNAPPFLLKYHPKTILAGAFDAQAKLGENAAIELVPRGKPGDLRFQALAAGKPAANVEVTVILPDGDQKKVSTDQDGQTSAFQQRGRYGAWTRRIEDAQGEQDGKPYAQIRHYATLVVDIEPDGK